ncbi:UNKNOWN [Stylonychia lemnae]|uniref:Uncharacterized protein n=1 Tax=Stylonychia lemnae TaxID=5949 RepID=A0A077ZSF9_STYLE|nr:UNKNOWN [Stylonychia lemnae]|eukprot:CDW71401.1 UNKNOWN [Stylonychia lemnae]
MQKLNKIEKLNEEFAKIQQKRNSIQQVESYQFANLEILKSNMFMQNQNAEEILEEIQDLMQQRDLEVNQIKERLDDEKKLFALHENSGAQLEAQISSLKEEVSEINYQNSFNINEITNLNQRVIEMRSQREFLLSDNQKLLEVDYGFTQRVNEQISEIQKLSLIEQEILAHFCNEEFLNHLRAETPFNILVIRDMKVQEQLQLQMLNNGYRNIFLGVYQQSLEVDKVYCDDATQQLFIDWTDNIQIEQSLLNSLKPCIDFICRPYDETLQKSKNASNRKQLVFLINQEQEQFLEICRLSFEYLNQRKEVGKFYIQNRKEELQFTQLHEFFDEIVCQLSKIQQPNFILASFETYDDELEPIHLQILNIITQEDHLFEYLLTKMQLLSAYQPGQTRAKYKQQRKQLIQTQVQNIASGSGNNVVQHNSKNDKSIFLEMKYQEFTPIIDLVCNEQPITFLITNLDSNSKLLLENQYMQGLLKFIKQFSQIKVASSKRAVKYYQPKSEL